MNYECGLLVDSFDKSPCFMMTYNQNYYEKLILENGFQKAHDLLAYWGHIDMLAKLDKKPGQPLEIHDISLKPYSCCRKFHALIDARAYVSSGRKPNEK